MNLAVSPPEHSTAELQVSDRLRKKASRHIKERVIEFLLFFGGGNVGVYDRWHYLYPG
jgi:hypothetical protein